MNEVQKEKKFVIGANLLYIIGDYIRKSTYEGNVSVAIDIVDALRSLPVLNDPQTPKVEVKSENSGTDKENSNTGN